MKIRLILATAAGLATVWASAAYATPGTRRNEAILQIHDVQTTTSPSGDSPLEGETVLVTGIVTGVAPLGRHYYLGETVSEPFSGIKIEGPSLRRRVGEFVFVKGIVAEIFDETRILETSCTIAGTATPPAPAAVTIAELEADGEKWEGVAVRIDGVRVESRTDQYGEFQIADATGEGFVVDDEFFTSYMADVDDTFTSLTGLVSYGFGSHRLEPRDDAEFSGWVSGRGFPGRLEVTVVDEAGAPLPSKVTLFPTNGSTLELGPVDRAAGSEDVSYLTLGKGRIALPFGSYDVVVSRGIEYGLFRQRVVVGSGISGVVNATLLREIDTEGWISGDFHLHCAPSFDTGLPVPGRIASLAGEGVEYAVATDHNEITDYSPVIDALGLSPFMTSSVGDEITTRSPSYGHFNSWPLEPGRTPLPYESVTPQQLFDGARDDFGEEIVQVNHPRFGPGGGQYFDVYELDPYTGRPGNPGFSFDFDALEVMNGKYLDDGLSNFRTWMTLLNLGYRITATGNSDSHHLVFREPGYPRNYIRCDAASVESATEHELVESVRDGAVFVSYGPIVDLRVNGAGLGALVGEEAGEARVEARVRCASWLHAAEARIFANGALLATYPLKASPGAPLDANVFHVDHPSIDTWYLLFVEGEGDLSPVARASGLRPVAFTNPIFVDADGDGAFAPPGLFTNPISIAGVDAVNGQGVPLRIGEWIVLRGQATTASGFPVAGTGNFYVDDGSGGVRVEEPLDTITDLARGDGVEIAGFVSQVLGETRVTAALVGRRDDVPGASAPIPVETGLVPTGGEALEGRVVQLSGVNFEGTWPTDGAEGQVVVDDGSGAVALSIPAGVVVPPEASALVSFSMTALVSQRDFSSPYTSGYRLVLRDGGDLFVGGVAPSTGVEATLRPFVTSLAAPSPNPSRTSVDLSFVRGHADAARPLVLRIADVRGRLVREWRDESDVPGPRAIGWDGLDSRGRRVASGVYFVRLEGGASVGTRRIVRLR